MYIIELTYKKAMSDVEKYLEAHRSYLDKLYEDGVLIASGPKNPRDGGLILAKEIDRKILEELLFQDPFYIEDIAHFKITEFAVTKRSAQFTY